jgi:hypothetical protein
MSTIHIRIIESDNEMESIQQEAVIQDDDTTPSCSEDDVEDDNGHMTPEQELSIQDTSLSEMAIAAFERASEPGGPSVRSVVELMLRTPPLFPAFAELGLPLLDSWTDSINRDDKTLFVDDLHLNEAELRSAAVAGLLKLAVRVFSKLERFHEETPTSAPSTNVPVLLLARQNLALAAMLGLLLVRNE